MTDSAIRTALANRALLLAGEPGTITGLEPPAGSAHAQLIATLFDPAVALVLESRHWTFADKRAALARIIVPVSSMDDAANTFTTPTAHGLATNDRIELERVGGTIPPELEDGETYYVVALTTTTFAVTDELDGSSIDFTGTASVQFHKQSDRAGAEWMYELPSDCLVERNLVPEGAPDDWPGLGGRMSLATTRHGLFYPSDIHHAYGQAQRVPCKRALNTAGEQVIYTNLEDAELVYTSSATAEDPVQWSAHFKEAVVFQVAAGAAGRLQRDSRTVDGFYQRAQQWISEATRVDAQRETQDGTRGYAWDR